MCKKRKFIITLSVVLLAGVLSYLQWGRDADVFSTFFLIHQKNCCEEHITFYAQPPCGRGIRNGGLMN